MLEPIWSRPRAARPTLDGTIQADVAVIGGGLTGLLTAWRLQERGLRPVVLEADTIGSGQSGGTTAKITIQHGLYWAKLARQTSRTQARAYVLAQQAAVDAYEGLAQTLQLTGYMRQTSLLYTMGNPTPLRAEAAFLEDCGLPAWFTSDGEHAGIVELERQALLEPGELLAALAERLTVYEHSRVLRVDENGVQTAAGAVRAQRVVFADHFPLRNVPGLYFARMHQCRSEALLLDAPAPTAMWIAADDDAPNLRACAGKALLSGGSRRTGSKPAVTARQMAARWYPGAKVLARWAAQDAVTLDGRPYIGRFAPSKPHWYVATGYNGWGMSSAMLAAAVLSAEITGETHPAAEIVSPRRAAPVNALLKEAAVSLGHELTPGRPRCPHLGCHMRQNPENGCWECPCHGSRFDAQGHLLNGPAQRDCKIP